jgi:CDP-diacylglycerol--serine O-phosphatidyltransferase
MKHLPNAVTLLNLFLGSVATVFAITGKPHFTAIIIGICALLDFTDGMLARLLNARSPLGEQLDSLADLVSFGLAPSAIVYHYMHDVTQTINPAAMQNVFPFVAFLLATFAGLRLAIFNIDTRQTNSFIGLPTPANASFFASLPFVLFFANPEGFIYKGAEMLTDNFAAMTFTVLLFSWLMVSPLHMFSLKIKNFSWAENKIIYLFMALIIISLVIFGLQAVALIVIFYIILSLLNTSKVASLFQ